MSSSSMGFGFGARYMMDQTMRFTGEGLPVYIRMQTQPAIVSEFADIGFEVTVSGSLSGSAGYTDYKIVPQPIVEETPNRRAGVQDTQLQVGNTKFTISHTWVLSQMALFGLVNPISVFRDNRVMGLVYSGELLTIESVKTQHSGQQIIYWDVVGANASLKVTG